MFKRIAIADDNHFLINIIEEKLSFFEDIQLRLKAVNGKDLLKKLEESPPLDLILMDIEMPIMNGIEATAKVKERYPQIKVLMLTVMDNDQNIYKSIKAGADGYLLKETDPQTLYDSINTVLGGGAALSPQIGSKALHLLRNPLKETVQETIEVELSPREKEVLQQLCKGLTYRQIAKNLIVSPGTVRKHTENIYRKMGVNSKLEAIQKARLLRYI